MNWIKQFKLRRLIEGVKRDVRRLDESEQTRHSPMLFMGPNYPGVSLADDEPELCEDIRRQIFG